MKIIVQRALKSSVTIDNEKTAEIDKGYVLFVAIHKEDNIDVVKKMAKKIFNLRIFEDENEKMNLNITDVNGKILSISQFTLYAKLNGNRPSFTESMNYKDAKKLYDLFNLELDELGLDVLTGRFGADMKVSIINDGPVTIIMDSKEL